MGPNVKFVSAITDAFSNKKMGVNFFLQKKTPKLKIGKVPSKNGDLHQKRDFGNMSKPSQLLRSRRYLFSSKRLGRGKHKGRQGTFVETGSTFDTCPDSNHTVLE